MISYPDFCAPAPPTPRMDTQPSLYDVVTTPNHPNQSQARRYIEECADDLACLSHFLRRSTEHCWHNVHRRLCTDGDVEPYALEREAPLEGASLLQICIHRPECLYAYNEALIQQCRAHMPGADPETFGQLRLYNALLRNCPEVPSAMALIIFWWIANAHRGVVDMVMQLEPPTSMWAQPQHMQALASFCHAWITTTKNHDTRYVYWHAIMFRFALAHVVLRGDASLARRDGRNQTERVPKKIKPALRQAHAAALEARRRSAPPPPPSLSD